VTSESEITSPSVIALGDCVRGIFRLGIITLRNNTLGIGGRSYSPPLIGFEVQREFRT